MSIFLLCVQDNGGAGVVVTTSQTISSDSMVSHKRIKASLILHLTCHDYEKSIIVEKSAITNQQLEQKKVTRAEKNLLNVPMMRKKLQPLVQYHEKRAKTVIASR